MPVIEGIGDEVLYAALAAAAAPLAIAFSPNFVRKQPFALFQRGAESVSRVLKLLWAKVRLWMLRRAQTVLSALCNRRRRQVTAREAILRRIQGAHASSSSASLGTGGPASLFTSREQHLQHNAVQEDCNPDNFPAEEKDSLDSSMRGAFGCVEPLEQESRAEEAQANARLGAPGPSPGEGRGVQPRGGEVSGAGFVQPPTGEFCSVCHDEFAVPCQANCGHWFCAECILRVWQHNSALSPCRCPICRRKITLLMLGEGSANSDAAAPKFSSTPVESSEASSVAGFPGGQPHLSPERRAELLQDVAEYNRLFGGVPVTFWQRVLDMPVLLRRMGRDLMSPTRALSLLHNVRFVVCTFCVGIYVLSPLDIISEGLLGFLGLIDDAVFLVCVAFYLTVLYKAVLLSRASVNPAASQE